MLFLHAERSSMAPRLHDQKALFSRCSSYGADFSGFAANAGERSDSKETPTAATRADEPTTPLDARAVAACVAGRPPTDDQILGAALGAHFARQRRCSARALAPISFPTRENGDLVAAPSTPAPGNLLPQPAAKSLRAPGLGLACCGLCCCCAVLVVATLVLVLVLGVVNPLQEGGLAVEMCALRLCGADGVDDACVAAGRGGGGGRRRRHAPDRRVQPDDLRRRHPRPRLAPVHVAGALDEDRGAARRRRDRAGARQTAARSSAAATATPGYGSLRRRRVLRG